MTSGELETEARGIEKSESEESSYNKISNIIDLMIKIATRVDALEEDSHDHIE